MIFEHRVPIEEGEDILAFPKSGDKRMSPFFESLVEKGIMTKEGTLLVAATVRRGVGPSKLGGETGMLYFPTRNQMKLSPEQLHILQHSLGRDEYGRRRKGSDRNRFVTDPTGDDGRLCNQLVEAGLMTDNGRQDMCGGMHLYFVTDKGRREMFDQSPPPPKQTGSQKRYQEFLSADSGLRFGEWIKAKQGKRTDLCTSQNLPLPVGSDRFRLPGGGYCVLHGFLRGWRRLWEYSKEGAIIGGRFYARQRTRTVW